MGVKPVRKHAASFLAACSIFVLLGIIYQSMGIMGHHGNANDPQLGANKIKLHSNRNRRGAKRATHSNESLIQPNTAGDVSQSRRRQTGTDVKVKRAVPSNVQKLGANKIKVRSNRNRRGGKRDTHSNESSVQPNTASDALIKCDRKGESPEADEITISEFYSKKSGCSHNLRETVTFFHLGKAGGGTISAEMGKHKMKISSNHPAPRSAHIEKLQKGPAKTLIVNLRDPVDRFVSAFRWRQVVLCSPDDEREVKRLGAAHAPHEVCKTSSKMKEEERLLRETYKSDPNVLAKALCEDSPTQQQARKDYLMIAHSMTLSQWLNFLIDPKMIDEISNDGIQNVIALPLEKQGGDQTALFEQHIQQLQQHLLQTRYEEEIAKEILDQKLEAKVNDKWEHSSVTFYNSTDTAKQPPPKLSPMGECCLARHLRKDYQIIQTMLGGNTGDEKSEFVKPLEDAHPAIRKACSWGSEEQQELCRSDLKSMLSRRAQYLDLSLGTCSNIIADK